MVMSKSFECTSLSPCSKLMALFFGSEFVCVGRAAAGASEKQHESAHEEAVADEKTQVLRSAMSHVV